MHYVNIIFFRQLFYNSAFITIITGDATAVSELRNGRYKTRCLCKCDVPIAILGDNKRLLLRASN